LEHWLMLLHQVWNGSYCIFCSTNSLVCSYSSSNKHCMILQYIWHHFATLYLHMFSACSVGAWLFNLGGGGAFNKLLQIFKFFPCNIVDRALLQQMMRNNISVSFPQGNNYYSMLEVPFKVICIEMIHTHFCGMSIRQVYKCVLYARAICFVWYFNSVLYVIGNLITGTYT
jgi:hypothetical protein